jgi:aryl-alcohol dehydrogenase-like predicted oxidoreductase
METTTSDPVSASVSNADAWENSAYTRRFPALRYRTFAGRGTCAIGFGPPRERGEERPRAVVSAIAAGCNVIDSAPHYHRGAHERAIAEAVRMAIEEEICRREDLVVTTSVGPVPELVEHTISSIGFARLKLLVEERFVRRGIFAWPDLVQGSHCIASGFIRYSVEETIARTGLRFLDCVFLDLPASYRECVGSTECDRRVRGALETLAQLREAGSIRTFGIATDGSFDLLPLLNRLPDELHPSALRAPLSMLRQETRPLIRHAAEMGLHVFATACLDGGTPQYAFPDELDGELGDSSDVAAAVRWVCSCPGVATAVLGSRDPRHIREHVRAASLPRLCADLYRDEESRHP